MRGGIRFSHPLDGLSSPFEDLPTPSVVTVALQQDRSGVCALRVKKNDVVLAGQIIGESPRPNGASIHAPISGVVTELIKAFQDFHGRMVPAVVIESDGAANPCEIPADTDPLAAVQQAGVVCFDHKTDPLAAKLEEARSRKVGTLIVNALDGEPLLSSRARLLLEQAEAIAAGIDALKKILDLGRVILTVDANAAEAIAAATRAFSGAVQILPLRNRYPQAVDYLLVQRALNVEIPYSLGVRITDIGALLVDVEAMAAVGRGQPVVERFISVATGKGHVKNLRVAIGTPIRAVLEHCRITPEPGGKILAGGPMTGTALSGLDQPVTKEFAGVFVQGRSEVVKLEEAVCIKCGRCVEVCPMRLMPFLISGFSEKGRLAEAAQHDLFACIECGCCTYLCPVRIPMVQFIQFAKGQLMAQRKGV
ncbi:MAG: RnfABCDGE type electron transport complex subunit C [Desulfobacterales bacterium]|jgi:electron transport complex protein RnfC|nr:RnfABCDGE type electron transport complex subunit C [Desulfobacterales bacterium]